MRSGRLRRQGVQDVIVPRPVQEVHARLGRHSLLQLLRDKVVVIHTGRVISHPCHCRAHAAVQVHHPDGHLQVRTKLLLARLFQLKQRPDACMLGSIKLLRQRILVMEEPYWCRL